MGGGGIESKDSNDANMLEGDVDTFSYKDFLLSKVGKVESRALNKQCNKIISSVSLEDEAVETEVHGKLLEMRNLAANSLKCGLTVQEIDECLTETLEEASEKARNAVNSIEIKYEA